MTKKKENWVDIKNRTSRFPPIATIEINLQEVKEKGREIFIEYPTALNMWTLLWALVLTALSRNNVGCVKYEIIPINQAGIFYQNLGIVRTIEDFHKLITFTNITLYESQYLLINSTFIKSKKLFQQSKLPFKLNHVYYKNMLSIFAKDIDILSSRIDTIKHLAGGEISKETRKRRGLIDAGSSLLKWLIGTPSANDAKHYDEAINFLLNQSNEVQSLLKRQTTIMSSSIKLYNQTSYSLKLIEGKFNKNFEKFNNFSSQYHDEIDTLLNSELLSEHFSLISQLIADLKESLDLTIISISFAKSNILHPQIVTPKNLRNELMKIELSKDLKLPIPLDHFNNINMYYSLCKLNVVSSNNLILFSLTIPLVNNVDLDLYKLIPLPISLSNPYTYSFIKPSDPFLILSTTRNKFSKLKDLSNCQSIAGDLFLCHNTLLYSTSETTICEVLLRIRKPLTIPESCDMKTVNASIEIYHQISSNEWLFITTKPVGAAIICEDSTSDVIDISLERTGLLKLSARCKCFTSSTTLIAVANKSSTFRNHIPDVQILPSNIKDSRSTPIRLETLRLSHENLDSLETSRKELKDINDALERQLSKPFVEKHFSSSNILWFLTSLILVCLVLTIQHWIRKIRTKTTSPASTTVRFMAASESKSEVKSENTESPPTGVVKTFQTNREECDPQNCKIFFYN